MILRSLTLCALFPLVCLGKAWTGNEKLLTIDDAHPSVPLRLIVKPGATIYKERNKKENAAQQPRPFDVLYVDQLASGNQPMYGIAKENGEHLGFIDADQVIEWKQALVIRFRQPDDGGRKPVLMFKDAPGVISLANREDTSRAAVARDLYAKIEGLGSDGQLPDDFPVLSIEPKRAIDHTTQFYMVPILAHEEVAFGEHEGRALQVSIASKNAKRGATTLEDKDFRQAASQTSDQQDAKNAKVEIVFCIDLTQSMQRFVDISLDVARKVAAALATDPKANDRFRFGLWGYRDHGKEAEGFVVQPFAPQPVPLEGLQLALSQARASDPTGGDFPEDVLGGVSAAIQSGFTHTDPTTQPIRVLVLIGDAPGHDGPGDARNGSRMAPFQLRELASREKISVYAIHIRAPSRSQFHGAAEAQFRQLATNPGSSTGPTYAPVNLQDNASSDSIAFSNAASQIFISLKEIFIDGASSTPARSSEPVVESPTSANPESIVNEMFRGAVVEWIGRTKAVQAPNDITAWIPDRDLINPAVPAVDTCVLLTRSELDNLTNALNIVIQAGKEQIASGRDFFTSLQGVASTAIRLPSGMKQSKELKDYGLLPDFLEGLPYKSKVLKLTNESWFSMPATRQTKFIHDLESLINLYKQLHNSPDLWIALSENADPDRQVTPVPLEHLP
jgi:serine/threonine-protein kinase PpkA